MQSTIRELYNAILVPRHRYTDSLSQMRARATLLFSLLSVANNLLVLLTVSAQPGFGTGVLIGVAGALAAVFVVIAMVNAGHIRAAAGLLFLVLLAGMMASMLVATASSSALAATLPILYASLIWSWRGTLVATLVSILAAPAVGIIQYQRQIPPQTAIPSGQIAAQTLMTLVLLLTIGVAAGVFAHELQRALRHVSRLLIRLRATVELASQSTTAVTDLNELLKRTVNYIRDRFAFHRVQLFLVDPGRRFADLAASTTETDETQGQPGYRLAIGPQSAVGRVILTGEPVITGAEAKDGSLQVPALSARGIESELAVPLIAGDQIIGVLNMQSRRPNAFSQEDIDSLLIMANHVSIAIRNAQLFEEQRTALNENRRLFLEAEMSLREIQRLNQRLTGEAWQEYLRYRNAEGIGYRLVNNQLRQDLSWTPVLLQASNEQRPVIISEGDRQTVAVPVVLRNRPIGAIEVEVNASVRQLDALDMLQAVAQRLALSIDNARLFEQAQELAQQELEVNAISAKLQGITDIDEIVETTVSELGRVLGAEQATVRLGLTPRDQTAGGDGGSGGHDGKRTTV